jgi:hypothetical protein
MGKLILLLLLGIVLLVTGPLITIWSINTLFGLGIAYSFWTWLAVMWLLMVTFGQGTAKKRG